MWHKMKFKHFVVIRFSYKADDQILKKKKAIFEKITLESLRQQTNKKFTLVVIGDIMFNPEGFNEFILADNWTDKVEKMSEDYEWIITTRIDSDDYVTPDFIQNIQDNFEETDKLVLDFNGYRYETRKKQLYNSFTYEKFPTPFLSLIERTDDPKYCYSEVHSRFKQTNKVKYINKKCFIWFTHTVSTYMGRRGIDFLENRCEKISIPADLLPIIEKADRLNEN